MAYLAMMTVRLLELRRVLKPTGSLFLHCDPTASHYLKLVLDGIFDAQSFMGEIIWRRTTGRSSTKKWPRIHDVILHYGRSPGRAVFNPQKVPLDEKWLTPKVQVRGRQWPLHAGRPDRGGNAQWPFRTTLAWRRSGGNRRRSPLALPA